MTNGDRIRQMSNEELFADYLYATDCSDCDFYWECRKICKSQKEGFSLGSICKEIWMKWLNEEAE